MKLYISLTILVALNFIAAELNVVNQEINQQNSQLPFKGAAVDEVVVQSSLMIKPKQQRPQLRRVRKSIFNEFNILKSLITQKRVKRQAADYYGQSQATANAAAFQNYNSLSGFGNSAANAQGSSGGVGASAAGSLTQALNVNSYDAQNSAGASHALTFNLPKGKSVKFAATNGFANGAHNNNANSRAHAVSVNRI